MANEKQVAQFKRNLAQYVTEATEKVDLSDRSENELEAYLNRFIEDLQHDLDRFAAKGLKATVRGQIGATYREVRLREDRVQRRIVSILSRANLDKLDVRELESLKNKLDLAIPGMLGRFGHVFDFFAGETDDDVGIIDPRHRTDWLIQNVLVLLSGFKLGDLTAGETTELENHVQDILKDFDAQ